MTNFQKPTFSVPVTGRDPKGCEHGEKPWLGRPLRLSPY